MQSLHHSERISWINRKTEKVQSKLICTLCRSSWPCLGKHMEVRNDVVHIAERQDGAINDATKEGKIKKSNFGEHSNGDTIRQTT